jgi:hypothetical protein
MKKIESDGWKWNLNEDEDLIMWMIKEEGRKTSKTFSSVYLSLLSDAPASICNHMNLINHCTSRTYAHASFLDLRYPTDALPPAGSEYNGTVASSNIH